MLARLEDPCLLNSFIRKPLVQFKKVYGELGNYYWGNLLDVSRLRDMSGVVTAIERPDTYWEEMIAPFSTWYLTFCISDGMTDRTGTMKYRYDMDPDVDKPYVEQLNYILDTNLNAVAIEMDLRDMMKRFSRPLVLENVTLTERSRNPWHQSQDLQATEGQ